MTVKPLILAGKEVVTDNTLSVTSPYSGDVVSSISLASDEEFEKAILCAQSAADSVAQIPSYLRSEILSKTSWTLETRQEEFARLITAECAKPIILARIEVARAINTFKTASEEAKRIAGEVIPLDSAKGNEKNFAITRLFPVGVVYAITPFNFPLHLVAHKVAPAIAAGNCIILKPSSKAPSPALQLGKILLEAGLPPESISVLPASSKIAEKFVGDRRINLLTFTGSAEVGWRLRDIASHKRVILELGGNAACVIEKDASINHAVERCIYGAFAYSGQICISLQRLFVQETIYDEFADKFVQSAKSLKLGDPSKEETDIGPMIDESAARKVETTVNEAVSEGAQVLCGGKRKGSLYEPTVLTNVKPEMKVCCEEIFAPVVTMEKYSDFEDAIKRANDSKYGLQAGLFTQDLSKMLYAFERLKVGGVIINDVPTFRADIAPYGGVKESGLGREGVKYAISEMSDIRTLVIRRHDKK